MTEAQWLAHEDPRAMLEAILPDSPHGCRPSDRKLRLWVEACRLACQPDDQRDWSGDLNDPDVLRASLAFWGGGTTPVPKATRAALLRDIIGNPFRPVVESVADVVRSGVEFGRCVVWRPEWLTWNSGLVPRLARAIYDDRGFDRLPVLADALEEAGCTSEDVLRHCRGFEPCWLCARAGTGGNDRCSVCCDDPGTLGPATGWAPLRGPHVRGCWALDLLTTGKE